MLQNILIKLLTEMIAIESGKVREIGRKSMYMNFQSYGFETFLFT